MKYQTMLRTIVSRFQNAFTNRQTRRSLLNKSGKILIGKGVYCPKLITCEKSIIELNNINKLKHVLKVDSILGKREQVYLLKTNTEDTYKSQADISKTTPIYRLVFDLSSIHLIVFLMCTKSEEDARCELGSNSIELVNLFYGHFLENKKNIEQTIVELLECYRDNPSWTKAHFAAYLVYEKYFIEKEILLEELENQNNPDQWCPLHIAILVGSVAIVKRILSCGVDPLIMDRRQWSVMHYAVLSPINVFSILIEMPIFYQQLQLTNEDGATPVHLACLESRVLIMKRIMIQGVTVQTISLRSPKKSAKQMPILYDPTPYVKFDHNDVEYGFEWASIRYAGCPLNWVKDWLLLNRMLKGNNFDVNHKNLLGDTPLITCVKRFSFFNAVFEKSEVERAKMNTISGTNRSPLANQRLSWIMKLMSSGAKVNSQNEHGETALFIAVADCDLSTVQLLLIFNARVNIKNRYQESVLHLAAIALDIVQHTEESKSQNSLAMHDSSQSIDQQFQRTSLILESTASTIIGKRRIGLSSLTTALFRSSFEIRKQAFQRGYEEIINCLIKIGAHKCSNNLAKCSAICKRLKDIKSNIRDSKDEQKSNLEDDPLTDEIKAQLESYLLSLTKAGNKEVDHLYPLLKRGPDSYNANICSQLLSSSLGQRNMITFDGGYTDSGLKPLIESLILNELQCFLPRPIHTYFDVIAGSSFGAITAAALAIQRTPLQIFYFFLRIRELFQTPVIGSLDKNSSTLEDLLKKFFGDVTMADVMNVNEKLLFVLTSKIDWEPATLQVFQSALTLVGSVYNEDELKMPLWEVCRAAGAGLGSHKAYQDRYYDCSLLAANPTIDALANYRKHEEEMMYGLLPLNNKEQETKRLQFVLSIGSGMSPIQSNATQREMNYLLSFNPFEMIKTIKYLMQIKEILLQAATQTDCYITQRDSKSCSYLDRGYARINSTYNKDEIIEKLKRMSKLTKFPNTNRASLRTRPSTIDKLQRNSGSTSDGVDLLMETLWQVQVQLKEQKPKFSRIGKFLQVSAEVVLAKRNSMQSTSQILNRQDISQLNQGQNLTK